MKHFYFFLLFFASFSSVLFASGDPVPAGGRAWSLAGTTLTLTDGWALFSNAAGLTGVTSPHFLFACDHRYGLAGFNTVTAGFVFPTRYVKAGISFERFGDQLYNEQKLGIAFSHKLDRVSLGLKVNYFQVAISETGTHKRLLFELGGITEITPKLFFGAHVYNFNQARMANYQDERIPTVLKAGLSWRPISKVMLNAETTKDIDFPATFNAGVEYEAVKNVYLRTGISTNPTINYFGLGLQHKQLGFDYALRTHPILGWSHHLSMSLKIRKKTKKDGPTVTVEQQL